MNDKMTPKEISEKAVKEWFAYQNPLELEFACRVVQNKDPKVIFEIGTAHGASLAAWAACSNPEAVIALDPEDIPRTPEQQASFNFLAKLYNFQRIKRYTRDPLAAEELDKILAGRKVDFMFIDGAHGFDDVRYDFYRYIACMAPDGIVGFHDIYGNQVLEDGGSGVHWLWDRLKRMYPHTEIYNNSTMGIGFIYLGGNK